MRPVSALPTRRWGRTTARELSLVPPLAVRAEFPFIDRLPRKPSSPLEWIALLRGEFVPPARQLAAIEKYRAQMTPCAWWASVRHVWLVGNWPRLEPWVAIFTDAAVAREALMYAPEHDLLAALPSEFTVFRGAALGDEQRLSWSTEMGCAAWFALDFNPRCPPKEDKVIVQGTVRRGDVLAYFSRFGEAEVVVSPADVHAVAARSAGDVEVGVAAATFGCGFTAWKHAQAEFRKVRRRVCDEHLSTWWAATARAIVARGWPLALANYVAELSMYALHSVQDPTAAKWRQERAYRTVQDLADLLGVRSIEVPRIPVEAFAS